MGEGISYSWWMRDIPDDSPLTALSIPGTHNSCSIDGPVGFAKTQDRGLSDQLDAGIRFLDIRLAHYQDNLCVHHDVVCMEKSYVEVLAACSEFLEQHPSETILLSVSLTARGYAEKINPRLSDYLEESPRGRVGIIAMDYFEQPHELVANVIKVNANGAMPNRAEQ